MFSFMISSAIVAPEAIGIEVPKERFKEEDVEALDGFQFCQHNNTALLLAHAPGWGARLYSASCGFGTPAPPGRVSLAQAACTPPISCIGPGGMRKVFEFRSLPRFNDIQSFAVALPRRRCEYEAPLAPSFATRCRPRKCLSTSHPGVSGVLLDSLPLLPPRSPSSVYFGRWQDRRATSSPHMRRCSALPTDDETPAPLRQLLPYELMEDSSVSQQKVVCPGQNTEADAEADAALELAVQKAELEWVTELELLWKLDDAEPLAREAEAELLGCEAENDTLLK
ncbi:hypothetical protein K438DRAFT_2000223 [Mycena galopus ATCC 62051]|nr:hypothetical protein K438DRAFT_2000223 [Mycena galopus ATCC 62051]